MYIEYHIQAFVDAVKSVAPDWELGKPIPDGALDGITRESAEKPNGKMVDIRI